MKNRVISIICIAALVMSMFSFSVFAIEPEEPDNCDVSELTIDVADIDLEEEISLEGLVDKEKLKALIDMVSASNAEDVADEASYGILASKLAEAIEVYEDQDATATQVNDAYNALKAAIDGLKYIADVGILTNNSFTSSDKEWYPELSDPESKFDFIPTDSRYIYGLDSPEPILTSDETATKLKDGNIGNTAYGVDSGAADTSDTVVTFDLGTSYFVNGVDVFSQFVYLTAAATTHRNMKGYKIEVSEDGTNYTDLTYVNAKTELDEGEKSANYPICTGETFPAVSCRFVRLTVGIADNSARYNIGEVVIKGFKNPFSKDILFEKLKEYYGVTPAVYNKDTYAVFDAAYKYAESVYWDETATGREVYDAAENLEAAYKQLRVVGKIAILTNNLITEADRVAYSGLTSVGTNCTYTYLDGSNVDIVSQDKACTKAIGGNAKSYDTSCAMYGKWDDHSPASVLFDMGELCYITGVDEWDVVEGISEGQLISAPSSVSGIIEVYTSVDGVNFDLVSSYDNQRTDYPDNKIGYCVPQDFDATLARFVKVITYPRKNAHQLKFGEIYIKGYKAGVTAEDDYTLGLIDYKDENGTRIINLDGKTYVDAKGTVTSNLPYEKDAFVVTAAYDENGKMVGADVCKVPLGAYNGGEFECKLPLSGEAVSVKTFVWSGLSDTVAQSAIKRLGSLR